MIITLTIENQRVVYESHSQISHEDEERSFALFLLKTKEMLCISQKATDEIMNVIEIVNRFSNNIGSEVIKILKANGIDLDSIQCLDCALNKTYSFEKLRSKFMQNKYYERNFGLVVSISKSRINVIYVLRF